MRISIVTPSFNQGPFIEECLVSVKRQNYQAIEHIVVDGASTDGTVETLRRYALTPGWEHLRWVSEPDRGQSDALNKGFRMATGDIIGWLNSDDRYRPGCIAAVLDAFEKQPEVDVLYGDYTWIDETGRVWQIRREIEFSKFILFYHRVLYIPTTSTFFRRRIIDDENFIDLRFRYAMDYDFFLRLARRGYRFQHLSRVLADFRWHGGSKSGSQSAKQLEEHNRIAEMYSGFPHMLPEGFARGIAFRFLRTAAAGLRYSEKLVSGYYFTELRTSLITRMKRKSQ